MILTIFLADRLLFFVYGQYFAEAAFPMRIIVCSVGFIAISHQISDALIIAGKQKYDLITLFISVVLLIGCGITLTAQYGGVGMAYSYLTTCISLFVFHYYFFVKHVLKKGFLHILIKPGISAVAMAFFIYFLRNADIIAVSFFSLITYGMMLVILRVFTKQDIVFFRSAFMSFLARHDHKVSH
jgi:O-antigen/teichoic acid export membrane protein